MENLQQWWDAGINYSAYEQLVASLLEKGQTTGSDHSPDMLAYSKLNLQRMRRVQKTFSPADGWKDLSAIASASPKWLVITEGWCGDAAQTVSAMAGVAAYLGVEIRYVLRDKHPELMDQFLTNGTSRSIPILIFLDPALSPLGHWGPRPAPLQVLINKMRDEGQLKFSEMVEKVHLWYANDKSAHLQQELMEKVKGFLS